MIHVDDHGNRRGQSYPRSIVRLDGYEVWFQSWSVNLNAASQADDFTLSLPFRITRNQPEAAYLMNTPEFPSHLLTKSDILVEIYVGYPQNPEQFTVNDLTRLLYGYVDSIEISASSSGESVTLSGRNRIAKLLDTKTTEKYQNMTASDIAVQIAAKHGLHPAISQTYTLVGTSDGEDSSEMTSEQSEWDLLASLAEKENFELRVRDNALWFGTFEQVVSPLSNAALLNYTWGQNIESFTISRSPHAAKQIEVEVHSFNPENQQHILGKAVRELPNAEVHLEKYFYPNLTQAQAEAKANAFRDQLSRLELVGSLRVSGDPQLYVDRPIALYGVGLGLSQMYYVRTATHSFDYSSGYRTDLQISNLLMVDGQ